jgi:hypothetical protein
MENNTASNANLFPIDGSIGDNDTKTQLGGFVEDGAGGFVLTFSTESGRPARDLYFMHLNSDLSIAKEIWLTEYASGTNAINVKTAKYGDYFLVAWEEISDASPGVFKTMFSIVDADGNFIKEPQQFADMRFNRGDDFINLADGDVVWATGSGSQLVIYRLDYDATIFN